MLDIRVCSINSDIIKVEHENDTKNANSGLIQLVVALIIGGGAFYALCQWFMKQKNTKKYQLIPTIDRS